MLTRSQLQSAYTAVMVRLGSLEHGPQPLSSQEEQTLALLRSTASAIEEEFRAD